MNEKMIKKKREKKMETEGICGVGGEHRGVDTIQFISQRRFGWK